MMPRYKNDERENVRKETRQQLLDAAVMEFAQRGYHQANVDDISRAAGFAKGTIYNYFPSKHGLMLALIEAIAQLHYEMIASAVLEEMDGIQRLAAFFKAGFDFVRRYLPQAQVMVNNLNGPQGEFKLVMYQAYQPMFELVGRDILAYGIDKGDFRPVDPKSTAGLIMNFYLGTASQVDESGKPWLGQDQVTDFVLHALQAERIG